MIEIEHITSRCDIKVDDQQVYSTISLSINLMDEEYEEYESEDIIELDEYNEKY